LTAWTALAGRYLGLPPPRCKTSRSTFWVRAADGARLATTLYRPEALEPRATVFARTIAPVHPTRQPVGLSARLLAEQGHRVIVQECRGLHASEGRFDPFVADGRDGADTLDWLDEQPGSGGPLVLLGFGYAAHAAWATLAAARRPVAGLIAGFGARDAYPWLHSGGALELENTFELALSLAAAEREGTRRHDVSRAVRFRPLRDADRVGARRIEWLRDWLEHPEPDGYWEQRAPALPERPSPTLLVGSWYHPSLPAMLLDYRALSETARAEGLERPRLLVGPWPGTRQPRRQREKGARIQREVARAVVDHLESISGSADRPTAPVRFYAVGGGWRDSAEWPPAAGERVWYLADDARASEGGKLAADPPAKGAPASDYVYDPADAVPSLGGASQLHPGAAALGETQARGDVLCYMSEPLPRSCTLAGPASVSLYAASDASHTDFTARLSRVDAGGASFHLCDGIARVRLRNAAIGNGGSPEPRQVRIELAPLCQRVRPGERLRLDVSSSSFPRFDRHPNAEVAPACARAEDCVSARQRIYQDADHASCVRLCILD
jgi:putative CocE/NonD family hydrolase